MKKILVFTSTRADYGLLKRLIKDLKKNFNTKVVVSGTHFSKKYGKSIDEIIKDKIKIYKKIKWPSFNDKYLNITSNFSSTLNGFSKILNDNKFDLVILLGDRYETLSVAISCHLANVPIAHIHGGELTYGAVDDAFRHSITKLSQVHFVAHKEYKKRVIQLGEIPKNIFLTGALGAENIKKTNFISKADLEKKLDFKFSKKNILINFHPETLNPLEKKRQIQEVLEALVTYKDINKIFTIPGADNGNEIITKEIRKFVKKDKNSYFFESLGSKRYYSLLRNIDFMLGNSSSGILEMPSFKKITINLGDRQKGRLQANSIINVKLKKKSIIRIIGFFYKGKYKVRLKKTKNIFYQKNTSNKISNILKKINFKDLMKKKFNDLKR